MDKTIDSKKTNTTYGKTMPRERKRFIFYLLGMALPLIQFCIFYIYVNFNSLLMAFQNWTPKQGALGFEVTFASLDNFKAALEQMKIGADMFKNSLLLFCFNTVIGLSLALVFSFYIYKKYPGSGLFKVVLFLPKIIPTVVFALLFKYVATDVYKDIAFKLTGERVLGLFDNSGTLLGTVLFYNLWISFGVNVILFTGAMSGINESVVESAQLDGVNIFQEFFYITIPLIFPTLITFIVIGLAGVCTHQMNLFNLFGTGATSIQTSGYFIYVQSLKSGIYTTEQGYLNYSQLSAFGIILTLIIFPITFIVRKLLEKYGPRTD